jgi:nucleotide-binding universal stress UspA family protein
MKTDRILIPLDGSDMAEAAIAEARQIARADSTFLFVRAADARIIPGADVIGAQIRVVREAEEYMAALKDRLEKNGMRGIETHVWYGPAGPAIVDAAQAHKVDLIVMTTHGRSGLGRLVFGSVAESVLRGTRVPILLVRPNDAPVEPPVGQGEAGPANTPRTEVLR